LFRVSASRLPRAHARADPDASLPSFLARQAKPTIPAHAFLSVLALQLLLLFNISAGVSSHSAMAAAGRNAGTLALFDVDGTLTAPRKVPPICLHVRRICFSVPPTINSSSPSLRQVVTPEMLEFMKQLRQVSN
jgi:hypothetical protein